jgi:predicted phosphodiesterase
MLNIKLKRGTKLVVFGDVHEHKEPLDKLFERFTPSEKCIVVSVGDIYDKGFGKNIAESITDKLIAYHKQGFFHAVKGNHELSNIKKAKKYDRMTDQLSWWAKRPLSLTFSFTNHSKVTIVHGGLLPSYDWDDIAKSIEVCYIRIVDDKGKYVKRIRTEEDGMRIMKFKKPGVLWHHLYDGRFGYVVSGHDSQKDGTPKFYNHSCNLDSAVYHTGKLTAQVFEDGIRKELATFVGAPKYPDLHHMYRLMNQGKI